MRNQIRSFVTQAGGPDEIRRLLLLFYERMSEDALIGYFFAGKDLKHIADKQSEFILNAGGFLPKFEGRGPATAHTALPPIYAGHFDRRLVLLREVLTREGVAPAAIEAWVEFEEGFRAMIVTEEKRSK